MVRKPFWQLILIVVPMLAATVAAIAGLAYGLTGCYDICIGLACGIGWTSAILPRASRSLPGETGICLRCHRSYTVEEADVGLCCICWRDAAFTRVFGPDWRGVIKSPAVRPIVERCSIWTKE